MGTRLPELALLKGQISLHFPPFGKTCLIPALELTLGIFWETEIDRENYS